MSGQEIEKTFRVFLWKTICWDIKVALRHINRNIKALNGEHIKLPKQRFGVSIRLLPSWWHSILMGISRLIWMMILIMCYIFNAKVVNQLRLDSNTNSKSLNNTYLIMTVITQNSDMDTHVLLNSHVPYNNVTDFTVWLHFDANWHTVICFVIHAPL